jgi:molybdate transport repressor ModE-like protein
MMYPAYVDVSIKPALVLMGKAGERLEPQLFPLLRAIDEEGKLTLASRRLRLSYRYAWDLLEKWDSVFGGPLVRMERGKGAQLTPLGKKFLWAEQQISASLFPRLENIALELNDEISRSRHPSAPILRIHASHGYAVESLPKLIRETGAEIELRYMGSEEALGSLSRGQCDLAGFHLPTGPMAQQVWKSYAVWVRPRQQRIIRMVRREQGLIVAPHNPLQIHSLRDLVRREVRFVNRQPGSGTRLLLDALLQSSRIDSKKIQGYDSAEFTHAAVAAFVAGGAANAAFGVKPAASQFGLDFIPIATERYMLACATRTVALPLVKRLMGILAGPAFEEVVTTLSGSELDAPGTVATFAELLSCHRAGSEPRAKNGNGRRATSRV